MVVTCGLFLWSARLVLAASAEPLAPPWTLAAPGAAVQWWVSGCAPPLKLLSCAVSATARLTAQPNLTWTPATDAVPAPTRSGVQQIVVSGAKRYQQIYGIGSSLEASTDYNLHLLGPARRASLLRDLFDPNEGIGMTLARITIATSDFTPPPFYSYDDLGDPAATDVNLTHFSVERDEAYVLPAIRAALVAAGAPAAEDSLRLFASPWSAPAWMKSSNALGGGTLLKQHRGTYARYLLRFLEAYQQRGVNVSAMTVQNEPLQNDSAYPSMRMLPQVEGEVIEAMTKAFLAQAQGSSSATALKRLPDVWCFDHNWSDEWYPEVLLDSPRFADLIGGSAFHHYSGQPSAMSTLHSHHPDKPIYMSEGSEFGVAGASKIVTYFRNWASSYTAWVTMLDQKRKPNSGPFSADATMMELDTRTMKVSRNFEYYMYGHFSKYVRTNAIRIDSTTTNPSGKEGLKLHHVAFVNEATARGEGNAGATVVVVVNPEFKAQALELRCGADVVDATLPAKSLATFRWQGSRCV